ncbi:SH3 domain-containing protein [Marinimicrobium alkaliphilum]|uniref:SH3 domain-containing protein n=1 Tax=Marinimicrobium alkaliphilum TaxID=2202654 RepID=UPI000DB9A060|nr:SH3 domain-containing protein [Marinimicrobium alkaliphilum]
MAPTLKRAWWCGCLLLLIGWSSAASALTVTVDAAYIELHAGPGRGYPVFYALERGEQAELLKHRTGWVKVDTRRGGQGWIRAADLAHTLTAEGQTPVLPSARRDDYLNRRWEFGAAIGDFAGADALGVSLGYRMTPHLAAELRVSQNTGAFSDSQLYGLRLLHQPFPAWRVSPYLAVGGGEARIRPHGILVQGEDRQNNYLEAGLGAYVYLSQRFFMRAEYRNQVILTRRDSNEEVNEWVLGFNVFF